MATNFAEQFVAETMPTILENLKLEASTIKQTIINELTKELPTKTIVIKDEIKTLGEGGEIVHEQFDKVLKLVNNQIPVLLFGHAGTGKNHTAEQVAKSLELEFYFTGSVTQEYKLTGFIDANGNFQETQFYKAFKHGGVFFLDEVDASTPDALIILNAALANGYFDFPNGRVNAHENFRVIAGANTNGKGADSIYVGRNRLDGASLDRFAVIEFKYDQNIENLSVGGDVFIADMGRNIRKIVIEQEIEHVISPRAMKHSAVMFRTGFTWQNILDYSFLKGLSRDDKTVIISKYIKEYAETTSPKILTAFRSYIK